MKKFAALALFISLFASSSFSISVLSPVSLQVPADSQIAVGVVGPGQTFAVSVDPSSSSGGRYNLGGAYDQLFVSALPSGWSGSPSKIYGSPLQAEVTAPKDAADGSYLVKFTLWDESGDAGLGDDISFWANVTVSRDVMDMKVEPSYLSVGAGQPARFAITVVNKGIANDIFTIGSSGVRNWEFRRGVYIPSGTSKTLTYEIAGDEESDYTVQLFAQSSSSDAIRAQREVQLRVNTDLFSDYRAVNKGVLLFPLPEAPIYFVVGLLSNLLPA